MDSRDSSGLVLVLEDDERSSEALGTLLGDWGYQCVRGPAFGAVVGPLAGRFQDVRAIISDFHLQAGETGIDAVRRAADRGASAPVLLLTGSLRGAARRDAEAAGYRVMEKPADPRRLKAWLEQALDLDASGA